jgi:hypothetical protein
MILFEHIVPVLIGAVAGIAYGCFFVLQQRTIFFARIHPTQRTQQIGFFLARILILLCAGRYLLRSAMIPSILGTIAFFSMFWLVILVIRAQTYERI